MANFCYKCGSPLKAGATFCGSCGSAVQNGSSANTQPDIQPAPQPPAYRQSVPQQPVQPLTQQLAQQAYYGNMMQQNTAAVNNIKPKRYIFLRIILILICAVLLFFAWKDGIRNVKDVMREPSAFSAPAEDDTDAAQLQARYDEIYANPPEQPEFIPVHDLYSWLYGDEIKIEEGGIRQ